MVRRIANKKVILRIFILVSISALCCFEVSAQWDPFAGQWGKSDAKDLRIMTWNVEDGICSSNEKGEGDNNWTAISLIIASLRPDILLVQEAGDNEGNGTGADNDSVSDLEITLTLMIDGGFDPYHGNSQVTAYIKKYVSGYDLPYLFVSTETDGYNRNFLASRFPFRDLNGDSRETVSDIAYVNPHQYAPGGHGGIRGILFAEIDVPEFYGPGDLVVGTCHLKAGSSEWAKEMRLDAAKNAAYYLEHLFNGAGTGWPDPYDKIVDHPPAVSILPDRTPVILGGDFNEDELYNDRNGPVRWIAHAQFDQSAGQDGTDRDGTDCLFDKAIHPITGARTTIGAPGTKFDYLIRQDSLIRQVRAFVFDTTGLEPSVLPAELLHFAAPETASRTASDHNPVIMDFTLGKNDPTPWNHEEAGGKPMKSKGL